MKNELVKTLQGVCNDLGIRPELIKVDYPEILEHGDFSTNIALVSAKEMKMAPQKLAEQIISEFRKEMPDFIADISVAGPGFINFKIKDSAFAKEVTYGGPTSVKKKLNGSVIVEYTDPNTFKAFHIGHLMDNAIGESVSRLIAYDGTHVIRLCYPSDIGLHIAKAIWAIQKNSKDLPTDGAPIQARTDFLGKMYVFGTQAYDADEAAKKEIDSLNGVIYGKSDSEINKLYEKGRKWSLDHFELLYEVLGTKFDEYIYESEVAPVGLEIVNEALKKGIFEKSDGAIVFKGEKYGLHTRVFVNAQGLPTYEAKDMGLNTLKFKRHPDTTLSIIFTASEQNEYFKVIIEALSLIDPNAGSKTMHIGHGMLRFASGKMSSRTGKVILAEKLLADVRNLVKEKISDRKFTSEETEEISDIIAVGAIKFSILRAAIGGDIIFDAGSSVSFEGDSGPYLQYATVRANSVLEKAGFNDTEVGPPQILPEKVGLLEKLILRFPDIAERAKNEYAPQHVANYLITLASAFNSFYANQVIVDPKNPLSPYYVFLTQKFVKTMTDGLWILGIKVPKKM